MIKKVVLFAVLIITAYGLGLFYIIKLDNKKRKMDNTGRIEVVGKLHHPSLYIVKVDSVEYLVNYNGGIQPLIKK